MRLMARLCAAVAVLVLMAGCSGDGESSSPSLPATTTSLPAATTTPPDSSTPAGDTPQSVVLHSGTAGPHLVMALDDRDRPVVVFTSNIEGPHGKQITGDPTLRLVRCLDPGCSEVVEQVLATNSEFMSPQDLDLTIEGRPMVTYGLVEQSPEESGILICSDESCTDISDVLRAPSFRKFAEVSADGMPMIAAEVSGTARLTHCLDPLCNYAEELASIGEDEGNLLGFELTETGLPMFARLTWERQPAVEITWCETETCDTTRSTVFAVEAAPTLPAATFDSHHNPVLAYFDPRASVVTCITENCADTTDHEIGPAREFSFSGLWLTDDDRPLLAYRSTDSTGESWTINVATCDDPACTSGTIASIADDAWGASSVRVALDDDGYPVVGYVTWSSGEVYVYRCLDPRCEVGALEFTTFGDSDGVVEVRTPVAPPAEGWTRIATERRVEQVIGLIGGADMAIFGLELCPGVDHTLASDPDYQERCPVVGLSLHGLEWEWYRSDEPARYQPAVSRLGDDAYVVGGQRCSGSDDDLACIPIVSTFHEGSWTITDLPCDGCGGWIDTIGAWSGGLSAFGITSEGSGLWRSDDGLAWTRIGGSQPFPLEPMPEGRPFQFIDYDGLKAYGAVCPTFDCQQVDGALWVSADGQTWSVETRLTGLEGFLLGKVIETVDGLVALGEHCTGPSACDWALMHSTDGLNWQNITPGGAPAPLYQVFGLGDTVIGLGGFHDSYWDEQVNLLAETSDLGTWTYHEIPTALGAFSETAIVDGQVVAAGFDERGLAIWVRD